MRPLDFLRSSTFRWTLLLSGFFVLCALLTFAFIWQVAKDLVDDVDDELVQQANVLANSPERYQVQAVNTRSRDAPQDKVAGLFRADGTPVAGNLESLPKDLQATYEPQNLPVVATGTSGPKAMTARLLARHLPNGDILILGRKSDAHEHVVRVIEAALIFGLVPALCLSLAAGALLSIRAQKSVEEINKSVQRIIGGDLRERLPTTGIPDQFEKLSVIVNGMLDEMEDLIHSLAGVGDDIAHDLRTPLTRVRVSLERARENSRTVEDLRTAVDQAIIGLDQSLAVITALLRIAEIEHGRRFAGFSDISLTNVVKEVGDLYEPIAEDKEIDFSVTAPQDVLVRGDRDLLLEAVANLVDNAVKFTPPGGHVDVNLVCGEGDATVTVRDNGPGISPHERDLVTRRFYRSDKSRSVPGLGLGLSLVAAVTKLHGFHFKISGEPGCVVQIVAPKASLLGPKQIH